MTEELCCLVFMTLFFMFAWLPTSVAKARTYGKTFIFSNRDPNKNYPPLPLWAQRSDRAYENLKSYFPAFVVAILVLNHLQISDDITRACAVIFVLGRVLHFICYATGIPLGRGLFWIASMVANLILLCKILISGCPVFLTY